MLMHQLNPTIPLETPKGKADAHAIIDYGQEHNLLWVCFQNDTGECWTWLNKDVRLQGNITYGRKPPGKCTLQTPQTTASPISPEQSAT